MSVLLFTHEELGRFGSCQITYNKYSHYLPHYSLILVQVTMLFYSSDGREENSSQAEDKLQPVGVEL